MVKCKYEYCNKEITGNIVLCCTCGSFCNQECIDEYHYSQIDYCKDYDTETYTMVKAQ